MPRPKNSFVSNIRGLDIEKAMELTDFIPLAKRAAKLANNRLYKLEKAGLSSEASTSGVRHIDIKSITNKRSAVKALNKVRTLLANPLSTPGSVNKLYKQARQEYGEGGRLKIIAVEETVKSYDKAGNEIVRYKLVPKAVPYGTNEDTMTWREAQKALKSFWGWYDKIGQNFLSSDEAYDLWVESEYNSRSALKTAESAIMDKGAEKTVEYLDQKSTLYPASPYMF